MATTFEFYLAMILIVIFFVILVILIYLLLNPSHNVFDRIGKFFSSKNDVIQKKSKDQEPTKKKWFNWKK